MKTFLAVAAAITLFSISYDAHASAGPPRVTIREPADSFSYIVGAKIPEIVPVLSPTITSVSITPDIKATGLSFNKTTGKISGVPTSASNQVYTLTAITGTAKNPGMSATATIQVELHPLNIATPPAPSTAAGCEYTLSIGDFQSTNPNVTEPRVFVAGSEIAPGDDGLYHVALTDPSFVPIVDTNDATALPYGVFEVQRFVGSLIAGNRGHQNDDGSTGYVYYNAGSTLNCTISKVANVKGADGFEKEADGVAFIGHAGNDQYTVTGNEIYVESSTTGAADLNIISYSSATQQAAAAAAAAPPAAAPAAAPADGAAAAPAAAPADGAAAAPAAADAQAAADDAATQSAAAQQAANAAAQQAEADADAAAAASAAAAQAAVDAQSAADAAAAAQAQAEADAATQQAEQAAADATAAALAAIGCS